jgi:polysaccharide deacetylase family protein (PEP-CTERM system associated)
MASAAATTDPNTFERRSVSMRRPADARLPTSAFTVDVEDWYQSCWDFDAPISERVIRNVERILQMLADSGVRGTFFIQGRVAETFPGLVETIVGQGHEVQSHGYSHRPLFGMNHAELRDELERAKKTVEDAAGVEVTSFRAPDFSIRRNNLWALRVLSEVGFRTDSSVFPMRTRRYGVGGSPLAPHRVSVGDAEILEVPVAIWSRAGFRVPMAGGGYFRLIPRAAIERGIRSIVACGRPAIVYCHPYEFAPRELDDYPDVPRRLRVSQSLGRKAFSRRVEHVLSTGSFGSMSDVLAAWGIA